MTGDHSSAEVNREDEAWRARWYHAFPARNKGHRIIPKIIA
jgi:hypothetical protein